MSDLTFGDLLNPPKEPVNIPSLREAIERPTEEAHEQAEPVAQQTAEPEEALAEAPATQPLVQVQIGLDGRMEVVQPEESEEEELPVVVEEAPQSDHRIRKSTKARLSRKRNKILVCIGEEDDEGNPKKIFRYILTNHFKYGRKKS